MYLVWGTFPSKSGLSPAFVERHKTCSNLIGSSVASYEDNISLEVKAVCYFDCYFLFLLLCVIFLTFKSESYYFVDYESMLLTDISGESLRIPSRIIAEFP